MESVAKQTTLCDSCKSSLDPAKDDEKNNIQAKLKNANGESKAYHFCDETCMTDFLVARRKKKSSKASIGYNAYQHTIEVEM